MDLYKFDFMDKAFELAEEALLKGEVPIGCVFIYENLVIASGRNEVNISKNATRHAEIVALDRLFNWCKVNQHDLNKVLKETDLYVTVEPCIMCAAAVLLELPCPVRNIFYGAANDRFGGCDSVICLWKHFQQINKSFKVDKMIESRAVNLLKRFYDQDNPNTISMKGNFINKLLIQFGFGSQVRFPHHNFVHKRFDELVSLRNRTVIGFVALVTVSSS